MLMIRKKSLILCIFSHRKWQKRKKKNQLKHELFVDFTQCFQINHNHTLLIKLITIHRPNCECHTIYILSQNNINFSMVSRRQQLFILDNDHSHDIRVDRILLSLHFTMSNHYDDYDNIAYHLRTFFCIIRLNGIRRKLKKLVFPFFHSIYLSFTL